MSKFRLDPALGLEAIAEIDEQIARILGHIEMFEADGFEPWTCEQLRAGVRDLEESRERIRASTIRLIDSRQEEAR